VPPAVMSQGATRYQGVSSTGVSGVEARSSSTVQAAAPASERGGLGGVMAAALGISVPIVLSLQGHSQPLCLHCSSAANQAPPLEIMPPAAARCPRNTVTRSLQAAARDCGDPCVVEQL